MKTQIYYLLFLVFFYFSINSGLTQTTVRVSKGEIKINDFPIKSFQTIKEISKILGEPERKEVRKTTVYYYDYLGISFVTDIGDDYLSSISVFLNVTLHSLLNEDLMTKNSFKGNLIISGYSFTRYSALSSLLRLEEIFIKTNDPINSMGLYQGALGIYPINFTYNESNHDDLLEVQISIK